MYDFTVRYDEDKWKEVEDNIHQIYSTHPDPRSAEAAYSVASAISDAFPSINFNEAMRNSPQIIEKFTGQKLDTQGIFGELKETMKAQSDYLNSSMQYGSAMLLALRDGTDTDKFKEKIHNIIEEDRQKPPSYRNDFKDMGVISDMLIETGKLAPSMLPTLGIYTAGGVLSPFTGGASLAAARAAGSVYNGMIEAGSVVKDLYNVEDDNGNKLGDDYILAAWGLTMAGMTALNFATSGFEKVIGTSAEEVMKNVFGKQAVKKLVKSGAVRNWGRKVLTDYVGKGIVGESVEEALEEFIGMSIKNYEMDKSNKDRGTLFKGSSRQDIIDAMKQVGLSTAKGMVFGGALAPLSSAIAEYKASDTGTKRNANKYTKPTEDSIAVDMDNIKYAKATVDKNLTKVDAPIKVIKVGEQYKPADATAASQIASLRKNGARNINVEVVSNESEFTKESVSSAVNYARSMQHEYKDGVVLFDDAAQMTKEARAYALKYDSVKGFQEQEGQIVIEREGANGIHKLVFQTKDFHQQNEGLYNVPEDVEPVQTPQEPDVQGSPDLKDPVIAPSDTGLGEELSAQKLQEQATMLEGDNNAFQTEKPTLRPEDVVKRQYNYFQRTLIRKGATETEHRFINDTLLPKIHDVMKKQFPDMSEQQIYETAIPSSYFAFVTSKVAGMTTDEFFNKHFTPEAFVALTAKQEKDYINSQPGMKSIGIQTGNSKNNVVLNGLTIPEKGKNTIGIGRGYSPLTVVHEIGHVMVKAIQGTDQFKPFMDIYKEQLAKDGGSIGVNFQEAFAKDLEQYFIDGKVRDNSLKTMFKKIGDGIREFLHLINPVLDNNTRKAFDKLFDFGLEDTAKFAKDSGSQMELDLFGDPESVAEALGKISYRGTRHLEEVISDYRKSLDVSDSDKDWNLKKTIAPHWFWLNRLRFTENDSGETFKLNDGPIRMGSDNISHIVKTHGDDNVNLFHVSRIARELANPVMVIKSPSNTELNKDGPLFVTRYYVNYKGTMQPLLIALRNHYELVAVRDENGKVVKDAKGDTVRERIPSGLSVNSMYPWKPDYNNGKSIAEYALDGNILAINSRALTKESLEYVGDLNSDNLNERIKTRPVNQLQTLPGGLPDVSELTSDNKILDIAPFVNEENLYNFFDKEVAKPDSYSFMDENIPESDQVLAKVTQDISKEEVKQMLSKNEYPSDAELKKHAGDPDVDWEIQFRRIMMQDPAVFKAFKKALSTAIDNSKEEQATVEQVLAEFGEQNKGNAESMFGEVRDPKRFVERLMWQSKFVPPTQADKVFYHDLAKQDFMAKVLKVLTDNSDPATYYDPRRYEYEQFLDAYKDTKVTGYLIRKVRESVKYDLRDVRRRYLELSGDTQQLSFEKTVEGSYLDSGVEVEAFGNEEIKNLLESKDTDPVLKELIRKNLATGDALKTLVNEASSQIEQLQNDIAASDEMAKNAAEDLKAKQSEFDSLQKTFDQTEKKYRRLQKTNTKNYEKQRMTERINKTLQKRIQYAKALQIIEKSLSSIKAITNGKNMSSDSRIMNAIKVSVDALFSTKGEDMTEFFQKNSMTSDMIPPELKPFFDINQNGIFAKNIEKDGNITEVTSLYQAVRLARDYARSVKANNDANFKQELFVLARGYANSTRGVWFDTDKERKAYMTDEKMAGEVKENKNKPVSFFERNFLTMSRIMYKIDPKGDTLRPFILGGKDRFGVFHRGVEGVLDDEKRGEYVRYSAMRNAMKEYHINQKDLLKDHITLSNTSTVDGSNDFVKHLTLQQAMGVYIYSKQVDGYKKLTSPNGNKFLLLRDGKGNVIVDEVQQVIDSLNDEQKSFADYMINDMANRWEATDEVYYKINNKRLGKIANYFPFVQDGVNKQFEDLMEDQYLRIQDNVDDSNMRERIGGDYPLRLDAFSIWNKIVSKQEHYIAGAEFFHKANRLLHQNGGDVYNLIAMNAGKDYATSLQEFINRVARKRHIYDDADTMLNQVRSNLVVARLGFNMLTVLKQVPALGLFAMEFGPVRLFEAITHITTDYKGTSEFIYDKSPQMRGEGMSIDFSSFMQLEPKTKAGRVVKKVGEVGMTPIQFVDGFIKKTLWYGAYQNNIANGMTDQEASMEATRWIHDTQPGGTAKDSSAIYDTNNTLVKYLLMFTNQLNKNLNILYDIPHQMRNEMYGKAFKSTLGLGLSLAGIIALEGGFKDGNDDDNIINEVLRSFAAQIISLIPVFGPEISDYMNNRYYSDNGIPLVGDALSLVSAVNSGNEKRMKDRTAKLGLGFMEFTGLPAGQMNKVWNAFTKDDSFNPWYLLGNDFVE